MIQEDLPDATGYKACCAALYENVGVRFLLGDSWRPGGTALTEQLTASAALSSADRVLDLACGIGESTHLLRGRYGCAVVGLDLAPENARAAAGRETRPLVSGISGGPPGFAAGDAESLPFADRSFDAVLCECAVSTFSDQPGAISEVARVLRPGGRLCLSDVTLAPGSLSPELDSLFGRIACIGGALPLEGYTTLLQDAGLRVESTFDYADATLEFLRAIDRKLLLVRLAQSLKRIDLGGIDVVEARNVLKMGMELVRAGRLGYAGIIARKP